MKMKKENEGEIQGNRKEEMEMEKGGKREEQKI